jgi:hypothetical protein
MGQPLRRLLFAELVTVVLLVAAGLGCLLEGTVHGLFGWGWMAAEWTAFFVFWRRLKRLHEPPELMRWQVVEW